MRYYNVSTYNVLTRLPTVVGLPKYDGRWILRTTYNVESLAYDLNLEGRIFTRKSGGGLHLLLWTVRKSWVTIVLGWYSQYPDSWLSTSVIQYTYLRPIVRPSPHQRLQRRRVLLRLRFKSSPLFPLCCSDQSQFIPSGEVKGNERADDVEGFLFVFF